MYIQSTDSFNGYALQNLVDTHLYKPALEYKIWCWEDYYKNIHKRDTYTNATDLLVELNDKQGRYTAKPQQS